MIIIIIYARRAKKIKKRRASCQAVCIVLQVSHHLHEFRDIGRLEKVLIARRLLFKKITIMPKSEPSKLKSAICNVPVDVADPCNTVPVLQVLMVWSL